MTKTDTIQATTLTYNDKVTELPVRRGSSGPDVIDISTVFRDIGCFTYDPASP